MPRSGFGRPYLPARRPALCWYLWRRLSARILADLDLRSDRCKKAVQFGVGLCAKVARRGWFLVEFSGQAFNLVSINNAVGLGKRNGFFLALLVLRFHRVIIDHRS